MKKYISPEFEAVTLLTSDIVTVSGGGDIRNVNDSTLPGVNENEIFPA